MIHLRHYHCYSLEAMQAHTSAEDGEEHVQQLNRARNFAGFENIFSNKLCLLETLPFDNFFRLEKILCVHVIGEGGGGERETEKP
jgi:hypothetical protein